MNATPTPFPSLKLISQCFTAVFDHDESLSAAESIVVANAIPKRVADFKAGRYCARQALLKFDITNVEILQGKGREPLWPTGFNGSISHSSKMAGAVVGRQIDILAIGMDIEYMYGIKQNMWHLIFNDAEQELIRSKPDPAKWATLMFSLKESFYKMQYPLTGLFLGFKDIVISTDTDQLCFMEANSLHDLSAINFRDIKTIWTTRDDQLITLCYMLPTN